MRKIHLIILTDEKVEELNKQKMIDNEIEEQGTLIESKAAGVKCQTKNLKS